jgi:transcriptional regulator with XRE-family HTH domain
LHAARIASERYMVSDMVAELCINDASYRAAEAGRRRLTADALDRVCSCFRIRPSFLLDGSVATASEEAASEIAALLDRVDAQGIHDQVSTLRQRLRWGRASAGHPTAHSAAISARLSVSRLAAHEQGRRPIPIDQVFHYAKVFGIEPGVLLFDEGSASSTQMDVEDARRLLQDTPVTLPWLWVDIDRMAMLERKRRRFHHGANAGLAVHSGLIAVCSLVERTRTGTHLHLLAHPHAQYSKGLGEHGRNTRPSKGTEPPWLICDGVALRVVAQPIGEFRDPLEFYGTIPAPLLLGRLLASVQI